MQCQDLSFNSLISSRRQKDTCMIFSNSQRPCIGEDTITAIKSHQTTLNNDELNDGDVGEEQHFEQKRNDFSFQEEYKGSELGNYSRNQKINLSVIKKNQHSVAHSPKEKRIFPESSTQKTHNTDKQFDDKKTIQTTKSKQHTKRCSNYLLSNFIKNDVRGVQNDMSSSICLMGYNNSIQKKLLNQDNMQTKKIWRFHFFKMLLLTNRFIFKMKKILVFRHPELLKMEQSEAINDKAFFAVFSDLKKEKSFVPKIRSRWRKKFDIFCLSTRKKLKSFSRPLWKLQSSVSSNCQQLGKYIPLFEPLHPLFLLWDCIAMAQILFNLILIPLEISFSVSLSEGFQVANYVFFVLDLLISLNTRLFLQGESEKRRWAILKNFVNQRLLVECLCLICLNWNEPLGFQVIRMAYVMKVKQLTFRMDKIREISRLDDQYVQVINLYILLFQILYLCHIFGCLWYKLGAYVSQELQKPSWLDQYKGEDLEKYELYANSIYFAVVTITTIGYGDISPIHPFERMFVIFMALLSCVSFGYALNQIGSLIAESNAKQQRFREKFAILNKYMTQAKVSPVLQNLARKDFKFTQEERSKRGISSLTALSTLSLSLQSTIKQEVNVRLLQSVKQLNSNFSLQFLQRLALCLQEKTFVSGEVILEQEKLHSPSLFIITQGRVQLSIRHSHSQQLKHFKKLHSNSSFGVYEFLIQTYSPIFTATSLGTSTVVSLDIKDFLKELEEFSADKETYNHMKDQLLFAESFQKFDLNCVSCKSTSHLSNSCHLLGYHPNKLKIISDHLDQEAHQVSSYQRPYRNKFSSVGRIKDVEQSVKQFIIEEISQISEFDRLANQSKLEQLEFKNPVRSLSNIQLSKQSTSRNTQLKQQLLHSSSVEIQNNTAFQHQDNVLGIFCKPKVPPEKGFTIQNSITSSYFVSLPLNCQQSLVKGSDEQIRDSLCESCETPQNMTCDQVNDAKQLNGDNYGSQCQDSQLMKPLHAFEAGSNEFAESFMESIKSYKIYFPHNNLEVILQQQEKMLKSKKTSRRNGSMRNQRGKNKLQSNDQRKASTFFPNMFQK